MAQRLPQGAPVKDQVSKITTFNIGEELKHKPEVFVEYFDADHKSGDRVWNAALRTTLKEFLLAEAAELAARDTSSWDGVSDRWDETRLATVYPPPPPPPPTPAASAPSPTPSAGSMASAPDAPSA